MEAKTIRQKGVGGNTKYDLHLSLHLSSLSFIIFIFVFIKVFSFQFIFRYQRLMGFVLINSKRNHASESFNQCFLGFCNLFFLRVATNCSHLLLPHVRQLLRIQRTWVTMLWFRQRLELLRQHNRFLLRWAWRWGAKIDFNYFSEKKK